MRAPSKESLSTRVESARSMAVGALSFLAADPERLERFLSVTGLGPQNLRKAAADPAFYGSVLDYLLSDEPLLLAFAAEFGVAPDNVARGRQLLGGPAPLSEP